MVNLVIFYKKKRKCSSFLGRRIPFQRGSWILCFYRRFQKRLFCHNMPKPTFTLIELLLLLFRTVEPSINGWNPTALPRTALSKPSRKTRRRTKKKAVWQEMTSPYLRRFARSLHKLPLQASLRSNHGPRFVSILWLMGVRQVARVATESVLVFNGNRHGFWWKVLKK